MFVHDTIPTMDPEYERLLENYDDEIDMCNQLGINLSDLYD